MAAVATWMLWPAPPLAPIRSIAVLPLDNLSGDPEQDYIAAGMHEALISSLARIGPELLVISRTSVMPYKDTDKSLPEIASELGVAGVIEGSALREGDRVRITLQLIDARRDAHLWTESYEREFESALALQREIARDVASQIQVELAPEREPLLADTRPVDPEALDTYRSEFPKAREDGDGADRSERRRGPEHPRRNGSHQHQSNRQRGASREPPDADPRCLLRIGRGLERRDALEPRLADLDGLEQVEEG